MSGANYTADAWSGGVVYQGDAQYFFDRHHLTFSPIDSNLFTLFQKNLYVRPHSTKDWDTLPGRLAARGLLVLRAPAGTGRRTTALWLLRSVLGDGKNIVELEADWPKPEVRSLPEMEEHGCLLDMSSPTTTEPDARFGQALVEHGQRIQKDGRFLVVLTTPDTWKGPWTEGTRSFTIDLAPPDSHELIRRRLLDQKQEGRVKWLSDESLDRVWQEGLSAFEARELASHLCELKDSDDHQRTLKDLCDQFTGWEARIEQLLAPHHDFSGIEHGQAIVRSVVWAGALLEGCRYQSVIRGSEDFLKSAGLNRRPAHAFSEPSALRKLDAAGLERNRGIIRFQGTPKTLASAVLNDLWAGHPNELDELRAWIETVLQSTELNDDELYLVAKRVVGLAVAHSDSDLFQALRDHLTGEHRPLAVKVLTDVALSINLGNYMRGQLYNWARQQSSSEQLSLVADICGGELGVRMPRIALTRLRWVAANTDFGFEPLVKAFANLLSHHPNLDTPIRTWLSESPTDRGRRGVLIALASSEAGTKALLGESAEHLRDDSYKHSLSLPLRILISNEKAGKILHETLMRWGAMAQGEHFSEHGERVTDLLVDIYSGPILHAVGQAYPENDPYWTPLWERAVERGLERSRMPEPSAEPVTEPTELA